MRKSQRKKSGGTLSQEFKRYRQFRKAGGSIKGSIRVARETVY
jgi:hypothetical protein